MSMKITKEFVLAKLQASQKIETPENRQRHIKIINSKQKIIGVPMAKLRELAKEILKGDYEDFLMQAKVTKSQDEFFEETLVQGLVIGGLKNLEKQKNCVSWFTQKIDNWGICDSMVSTMKALKNSKEKSKYFEFYYNLCFCEHEYAARVGIVCLMVNFLEREHINQILDMCKNVKSEAYYVQMAVAWLLSCAIVSFETETLALLQKQTLPKFIQNKTISKCQDSFRVSPELKSALKTLRIK